MELKFVVEPHQLRSPKVQEAIENLEFILNETRHKKQNLTAEESNKGNHRNNERTDSSVHVDTIHTLFHLCDMNRDEHNKIVCTATHPFCPFGNSIWYSNEPTRVFVKNLIDIINLLDNIDEITINLLYCCVDNPDRIGKIDTTVVNNIKEAFRQSLSRKKDYIDILKETLRLVSECDIYSKDGVIVCLKNGVCKHHIKCPFNTDSIFTCKLTYECFNSIKTVVASDITRDKYIESLEGKPSEVITTFVDIYDLFMKNSQEISIDGVLDGCGIIATDKGFICNVDHHCPLSHYEDNKNRLIIDIMTYANTIKPGSDFDEELKIRFPYLTSESIKYVSRIFTAANFNKRNNHVETVGNREMYNEFIQFMGAINTGLNIAADIQKNLPSIVSEFGKVATGAAQAFNDGLQAARAQQANNRDSKKES